MNELIRNAVFTEHGDIDCEVNHSVHGWISYNIPKDGGIETRAMHLLAAQSAAPSYSEDPATAFELLKQRKIVEINAAYVDAPRHDPVDHVGLTTTGNHRDRPGARRQLCRAYFA